MAEDPIIKIKTITKEELEVKMGMKIPNSLGDNEIIMGGGDEPITSELAALFEKAGMKVTRKDPKETICCSFCDGTGKYEQDGDIVCCSYCDGKGIVEMKL